MLHFAYDGSINGDWVSHYAVRLASNVPDRVLHLVHIKEGRLDDSELSRKLERLRQESVRHSIHFEPEIHAAGRSPWSVLREISRADPGDYLVCGTRAREGKKGYLSGSVAERLLLESQCPALAIRVVRPGLLGNPGELLVPLAGRPDSFASLAPFFRLLAPAVTRWHLLLVVEVSRGRFQRLSRTAVDQLQADGEKYLRAVEEELAREIPSAIRAADARVVVSDDAPKEIVLYANRVGSGLIYLGASQRSLTERFLYGNPVEQILREASCDVAIHRGTP